MTLTETINQYEHLRLLILGNRVGLDVEQPQSLSGPDAFDAFVSSAYMAVREALAEDHSFLAGAGLVSGHPVNRSLYLLRTARQHIDNREAVVFYSNWIGVEPVDWNEAAARLIDQIDEYLRALTRAAQAVRQSRELTQKWLESDSVSVATVFASVCRDLRLSFPNSARQAKIRAVEGRFRRERPQGSKNRAIAEFCVQEALSESTALPIEYSEFLDSLGLIGRRDAAAALTLAYATARALPQLDGEAFQRKASEMWWSLVGA